MFLRVGFEISLFQKFMFLEHSLNARLNGWPRGLIHKNNQSIWQTSYMHQLCTKQPLYFRCHNSTVKVIQGTWQAGVYRAYSRNQLAYRIASVWNSGSAVETVETEARTRTDWESVVAGAAQDPNVMGRWRSQVVLSLWSMHVYIIFWIFKTPQYCLLTRMRSYWLGQESRGHVANPVTFFNA